MDDAFFAPFSACNALEEVVIVFSRWPLPRTDRQGATVRLLAALPALSALTLTGTLDCSDVPHLAALTGLRQLRACQLQVRTASSGGAQLGAVLAWMTQLTELGLPRWVTKSALGDCRALDAVVAQLGGLRRLTALSVDSTSTETRLQHVEVGIKHAALLHGFHALSRLTALTRLCCPMIDRRHWAASGALPLLQRLHITSTLSGDNLAATLRPLRPLRALQELTCTVYLDTPTDGPHGDTTSAVQAALATWQAATLLAEAPHLRRIDLKLLRYDEDSLAGAAALGIATALVVPLLHRLTTLRLEWLYEAVMDALWPVLSLATRLEALHLSHCRLSEGGLLLLVGRQLPGLRVLQVHSCDGVTAASHLALAGLRKHPLHVVWCGDPMDTGLFSAFRAIARAGVVISHEPLCEDALGVATLQGFA